MYTRSIIGIFSKAKAAKLIRELVDLFLDMESSTGDEASVTISYMYVHDGAWDCYHNNIATSIMHTM